MSYNLRRKRVERDLAEAEKEEEEEEEEEEMEPSRTAKRPKVFAAHLDATQSELIRHNYRLPMETLQHIFLFCLPDDSLDVDADPSNVPLLVAQVCHFWREVALATPRLWSSIYINTTNMNSTRMRQRESQLRLLRLWLSRTGSCSLAVNVTGSTEAPAKGLFWRDFGPLFAQAHRLYHLSIHTHALQISRFLRGLCKKGPLPLKTLRVSTWDFAFFIDIPAGFHHVTPKLHSLRLSYPSPHVPWHQLTSVSIDCRSLESAVIRFANDVLSLCTQMVEFELSNPCQFLPQALDQPLAPPVELPKVQTFRLLGVKVGFGKILDILTFPSLHDLVLDNNGSIGTPWRQEEFLSFVSRSPNITRLKLYCILPAEALLECLQHMPTLEGLDSYGNTFTRGIIESLCPDESAEQTFLVPKLKGLSLKGPLPSCDIPLARLVRSRWKLGHSVVADSGLVEDANTLESVTLNMFHHRRFDHKALAIVQECIQEGLSFSITDELKTAGPQGTSAILE